MFEHIMLLTTVVLAATLVRLLRRFESAQRIYMVVVGIVLALSLFSLARSDRFLGVVAVGLCVLTVAIPFLLEAAARHVFGRGRLGLAVRIAGLRALLMPGAGLGRQQEILRGLAVLEDQGVDAALEHFHGLAGETEDGGELAIIHEQIVSMLFYGQRWSEGIAHYEGRFHPGYAAMRPALALGLLRAYGESGRLDTAAGLLRALEEGPIGTDPRALELISQARLTFLAYTGAEGVVRHAVSDEHCRLLGISLANGALFRGIALARAGQPEQAEVELRRVESLAGPQDRRVVEASRTAINRTDGATVDLEPEVSRYAQAVAERLQSFLRAAPTIRRSGALIVTGALIVALAGGYLATLWAGHGGLGLLIAGGLTPELWRAGSWGRVLTGAFPHSDAIGLLLNVWAVWLAGPVIERVLGSARLASVAIVGGAAGLFAAVMVEPDPSAVLAGGNVVAIAVVVGALWTLLPSRTPALLPRARRSLLIPLVLILIAQLLAMVPPLSALRVPPFGLAAAAVVALVLVGVLPAQPRGALFHLLRWLPIPLLIAVIFGGVEVAREDVPAFLIAHRDQVVEQDGVYLRLPSSFREFEEQDEQGFAFPIQPGVVDTLQLRGGQLFQLLVLHDIEGEGPKLLAARPKLAHGISVTEMAELPGRFVAHYAGTPEGVHAYTLRRNGEPVASLVERELPGSTVTLVVLASPAAALDHQLGLAGAIVADAALVSE